MNPIALGDPGAGTPSFYLQMPDRTGGTLLILNESPYGLNFTIAGTPFRVPADTWREIGVRGAITTPVSWSIANSTNPIVASVSDVVVECYGENECVNSNVQNISRQTNVGNLLVTANSIVNDGNAYGTNVVESTPTGSVDSYLVLRNDGTVDFKSLSNGVETDVFHLTAGGVATPAKLVLQLVQILGALSADSGAITTDGVGDLSVRNLKLGTTAGGNTISAVQDADMDFDLFPVGSPASKYGFVFGVWTGAGTQNLFGIAPNSTAGLFCWVDGSGVVHASAPTTLITGNQFSGTCGVEAVATAASQALGQGQTFAGVCTNVPSSITLTVVGQINNNTPTASQISTTGFWFSFTSVAAGVSGWRGTYVTVGNCLLAVDSVAGTFDHHCDGCGTVRRTIPVAELTVNPPGMNGPALAYGCVCGTTESFTPTLTAADEQDTTPQGTGQYATTRGAQAALIRQLQQLAGIPLIETMQPTQQAGPA